MRFRLLLGTVFAFGMERQIPSLMLSQKFHPISKIGGNDNILDPLVFEKIFRDRMTPIIIHTRVVRRDYTDESTRKGEEIGSRESDADKEPYKPYKYGAREDSRAEDKRKDELGKIKYYVPVVILIIVAGICGFYFGKSAESRNYVRVPTNN